MMKNPLEKKSPTGLYVALGAGALIAGTLAYLFLTENGNETLGKLEEKVKDILRDSGSDFVSKKTGIHRPTVRKVAEHVG